MSLDRLYCLIARPNLRGRACAILMLGAALPALLPNAFAQSMRLEQMQQVGAGGRSESGSFTLFSTAGAVSPSGEMSQAPYSTVSGGRLLVSEPPSRLIIIHAPSQLAQAQAAILVSTDVDAANRIRDAQLFYKQGGEAAFESVAMQESAQGSFEAVIPGEDVTSRGVVYYIIVTDVTGRMSRGPSIGLHAVSVHIDEPGLLLDEGLPGGVDQGAYRLISVPLDLENKDPEAVLSDDFGSYEPFNWRFFELAFDQSVAEYPNTSDMTLGKGFWLIAREANKVFDTGPGASAPLNETFSIALHPRWNLIGNPFDFEVPVENLSLGQDVPFELRSYEGGWNNPINDRVSELQPFEGYAVFNPSSIVDSLYINPDIREDQNTAAGKIAGQARTGSIGWALEITALGRRSRDADNVAAVADDAATGWDPMDYPEPPNMDTFVSLSFPHPDWGRLTESYSTDVRPASQDGDQWHFEVKGGANEPVRLAFDGTESVPLEQEIWLVDEFLEQPINLRSDPSYSFSHAGGNTVRQFKLVVGSRTFISQTLGDVQALPEEFELLPIFPNPFNSSSTIRYALPEPTHVTLNVFNVVGNHVATLVDRTEAEGFHSLVWDGSGMQGNILPSGLYFLQLQAGATQLGQTVVIVR